MSLVDTRIRRKEQLPSQTCPPDISFTDTRLGDTRLRGNSSSSTRPHNALSNNFHPNHHISQSKQNNYQGRQASPSPPRYNQQSYDQYKRHHQQQSIQHETSKFHNPYAVATSHNYSRNQHGRFNELVMDVNSGHHPRQLQNFVDRPPPQ